MGLLRSETMGHGVLVLPTQDARSFVDKIGKEVNIQFEDMNADQMRRPYRKFIQRIDEMERILRFVFEELNRVQGCTIQKNNPDAFLDADANGLFQLDKVENELKRLYSQWNTFAQNNEQLTDKRNRAFEEAQVVATAVKMLNGAGVQQTVDQLNQPLLASEGGSGMGIGRLAGVISLADQARFERAIWRVSLGNAWWQFEPIEQKITDPKTGLPIDKVVVVIYFPGAQGALGIKLQKVCTAFGVNMYPWPANHDEANKRNAALQTRVADNDKAINGFKETIQESAELLTAPTSPGGNSRVEDLRLFCIKEKSIYSILNLCQGDAQLTTNVWYPKDEECNIRKLMDEASNGRSAKAVLVPDNGAFKSEPPTYIRTNEYTQGWQDIINTYGIPRYQEANPALLTVVTFPFIFGMMYGDIGHGSMLLMVGIYLVMQGEKLRYSIPAAFNARFMILSMGIFATYAGFMYNDFFSISLRLFTSGYKSLPHAEGEPEYFEPLFNVAGDGCAKENGHGPYLFGLDPAWGGADNELIYVNSLKMKLSVLFGVLQMFVGVCLKWSNAFHEKNMADFFCECIPMMVFLLCFFGWMDVMILYKWTHPMENPPMIINSLITMAMGLGVSNADTAPLWPGSIELATTLMQFTIFSVPIMLLPKPFILLMQHKKAEAKKATHGSQLEDNEVGHSSGGHGHGDEFEFGEVVIHQVIETIEFVLGTVSHTASYLRIWALSLAHQQLSLVFFQKTLTMGLEMDFPLNGIALYFLFATWFVITLGVLLGMDVLECFLHTLRLHWVEFQSKFYNKPTAGEEFVPYKIKALVEPDGSM